MPLPDFIRENLLAPDGHSAPPGTPSGTQPTPGPSAVELPYPQIGQQLGNWCWAAVSLSVTQCYEPHTTLTQCDIASNHLSETCCPATRFSVCDIQASIQDVLTLVGHYRDFKDGPPDFASELQTEIDANKPIVIRVALPTNQDKTGHFLAIMGYDTSGSDTIVLVTDPMPVSRGSQTWLDYDTLCNRYTGNRMITHTLWTK